MENGLDLDRRDIIIDYLHRMDNTVRHSKGISVFRRIKGIPATCGKKTLDDYVESARERRERMLDFINRSEHKVVADGLTMRAETAKQYADEKNYEALKTQSSARLRVELADEEYIVHKKNWEKAEEEAQRLGGEAHIAWLISQGIDPWKVSTPPILEEPEPTPPPTPGQFIEIDESSISNFQDQVIENSSKLSIEDWSKEMLATYLKAVDMEPVANKFLENFIDGQALKVMMDDILEQLIVDIPLGMQLKMRKLVDTARQGLTPKFPENVNLNEIPLTAEERKHNEKNITVLESKLEKTNAELAKIKEETEKETKKYEAKIENLGKNLNQANIKVENLEKTMDKERKENKDKLEKMEVENMRSVAKVGKLEEVCEEKNRALLEEKARSVELKEAVSRAEEAVKVTEKKIKFQSEAIKKKDEENQQLRVEKENAEIKMTEATEAVNEAQEAQEKAEQTAGKAKEALEVAESKFFQKNEELCKARENIAEKEKAFTEAGEKITNMAVTIEELLRRIAELEAINDNLLKEIASLNVITANMVDDLPTLVIKATA